jgi:hypothetical protein
MDSQKKDLLNVIDRLDQENPTLRGQIPVTTMIAPMLNGVFDLAELGMAIKELDKGGYLRISGANPLGSVSITDEGRREKS